MKLNENQQKMRIVPTRAQNVMISKKNNKSSPRGGPKVHLYDLLDVLDLVHELHLCHPPDVLELPDRPEHTQQKQKQQKQQRGRRQQNGARARSASPLLSFQ